VVDDVGDLSLQSLDEGLLLLGCGRRRRCRRPAARAAAATGFAAHLHMHSTPLDQSEVHSSRAGAELGKIFGVGCNLLTQKHANFQRRRNGQSDKQTCAAGAVEVGADNTVCPLNFTPTV